jgi:DNA-directed RNA polymerase subunit RPC12/RpoP
MSETTLSYLCPNCGAGLEFDAEKQKFACEFCLSDFDESELSAPDEDVLNKIKEDSEEYCSSMNEYYCPSCGAEVISDETAVSGICAFCQNPIVLRGKLEGQLRPDKIIPFAFDKNEAENRFKAFTKGKLFLPKNFTSREHISMIQGIYYPFFVTDADTTSSANGSAKRIRKWTSGETEYTEVSNFKIERAGNIHFEDIVTSAIHESSSKEGLDKGIDIEKIDKAMLEGVLPYPSDSLKDFSMPYLLGFKAKKRNIERNDLGEEVSGRMHSYARTLLTSTVGSYSSVDLDDTQVKVLNCNWEYALMPIWMLTYKTKKGKLYTFAMNGHTGKIYGELPISYAKLAILFASLTAAITPLLALIGGVLF